MRAALLLVAATACGRLGFDATSGPGGVSDDAGDGGTGDGGDTPDTNVTPATQFAATYTDLSTTGQLSARRGTGAASADDDRIWVFGGFVSPTGARNDLSAFTPATSSWQMAAGSGTPANRERHSLEWDGGANRLVVFGGYTGSFPNFSDTDELFVYQPTSNTWTQVPKTGTWPAPRKDASMVWAPDLSAFLVFGGNDGANVANHFGELWKLSIAPNNSGANWTPLTPSGPALPKLSAACVAYATNLHRLIVFSGNPTDTTLSTQTYQYLSDTNTWQLDAPSGTIPPGRSFVACAWDPVAERMIVYGGQDAPGNPINGVFTYEPTTQTWATPQMTSTPGNRSDVGATYSPALRAMVGYGGRTASSTYTNGTFSLSLQAL